MSTIPMEDSPQQNFNYEIIVSQKHGYVATVIKYFFFEVYFLHIYIVHTLNTKCVYPAFIDIFINY